MRQSLSGLFVLSAVLWACEPALTGAPGLDGEIAKDAGAPAADLPGAPPITMLVVLGDSVAYGFGLPEEVRFDRLLLQNDDEKYPELRGRDLLSRYPEIELINRAEVGANSAKTLIQALSVPPNPQGRTLVILSLGPTEFADNLFGVLNQAAVDAVAARVADNLEQIRQQFARPTRYPDGVVIGLFSVLDPTDGLGTLPLPVDNLYCNLVAEFSKTGNVQRYNARRSHLEAASGMRFVDIYQHFLGHGYFFAAPATPHYHPSDPSLWFQLDCLHPNERGHHEIRRLIWDELLEGR